MLSETLLRARAHLSGGWCPTVSRDAAGNVCTPDDEGVTRFSILDALDVVTGGDWNQLHCAMRALGLRVAPALLGDWEADPKRTHPEVLALFARAAKHAATKESR